MPAWQDLAAIAIAYALGCFTTAYYLVRLWKGQDIRQIGSGNVGGRNAGRVLGRAGFVIVVAGDVLKGSLAVLAARALGASPWYVALAMLAVVAGHIWPAPLRFHGGKGAATMMGALIAYDIFIALLVAGVFLLLFALLRSFTLAGLIAFAVTPVAMIALGWPTQPIIAIVSLVVLVLIAHRANIRAKLQHHVPAT